MISKGSTALLFSDNKGIDAVYPAMYYIVLSVTTNSGAVNGAQYYSLYTPFLELVRIIFKGSQ